MQTIVNKITNNFNSLFDVVLFRINYQYAEFHVFIAFIR